MNQTDYSKESKAVKTNPFRIFVNQAGYRPHSKKTAVMNFPCESFRIIDLNGTCRYEGKAVWFGDDKNSRDTVYEADFSAFSKKGPIVWSP